MKRLLLVLCFSQWAFAQSVGKSFPPGSGASYRIKLQQDSTPIELSIYVAEARVDSLHIEYFMHTKGLLPLEMWQQFEVTVASGRPLKLERGYVYTKELSAPERLPAEYLQGASGGVQVNDFLFATEAQLAQHRIGVETVEIAAGTTKATHYRVSNNGQTVDYWISDSAKPLGLVMLISKSEKNPQQNYGIELLRLVENVKARINPTQAGPLTEKGRSLLARPESVR